MINNDASGKVRDVLKQQGCLVVLVDKDCNRLDNVENLRGPIEVAFTGDSLAQGNGVTLHLGVVYTK
jgi:hypothetical protein